ncbi:serine/threonine-protein kinase UCNL [Dorcoceras hygrometricum]|uniref:Serine/threonine-protein kinase UCNL n=1 Tax=Dorcoceras hygrometricum TaxID=472368 RepID=A0A2Z7CR15_9LAMI|nr:serine/threonine-protein kinase UCNL [Dorcoceras hygrometricum]
MTFRVVRTNQYNQDLGLIHSTNGNHLESPNEGSSIDHQVTIHLHAQNITMFPTNETWYFSSQMLVSSSGGLILILTAQSTRNEFRMHTRAAPSPHSLSHSLSLSLSRRAAAHRRYSRDWTCSDHVDEEIPFVSNSSALLVQTDEGVLFPVVDRIRRSTLPTLKCQFPCESGRSQAPRLQQGTNFETSAAPPGTGSGSSTAATSMSRIISNQRNLGDWMILITKFLTKSNSLRKSFSTLFISRIKPSRCSQRGERAKAIIADMDERLATVRGELLDFRAQAQENYNNLSSQLGEFVSYINRDNDKKGEESSSRRPQPPPDDQNRPSGGSASRGGGGGGSGGSGRRDDRRGSSIKRGSGNSGAGGPYKKNAEWLLYGKNQF